MRNISTNKTPAASLSLEPRQFESVRNTLAQYGGIYLDPTNQRLLLNGLIERLAATGLSLDAYLTRIGQPHGRSELQQLIELVLNHETILFRNLLHMQVLREKVLPLLNQRKPAGEALRIWSAGCSTGEEPYSLAITSLESLGNPLPRPVQIYGTDLSNAALDKARQGIYRGRALTNVHQGLRLRYFHNIHDSWSLHDNVRELTVFEQFNLLDPFPAWTQGIDIIFCQNVTIYFQLSTFRNLVERFYQVLPVGGMLFLGFSETLWNVFDKFTLREMLGAFVYVKELPQPPVATRTTAAPQRTNKQQLPDTRQEAERPAASSPTSAAYDPERTLPLPRPGRTTQPAALHQPAGATFTKKPVAPPLQATPEPADIEQVRALLDSGQADQALARLNQFPLNGPHAPQVLALVARAHANRGDADLAVAEARRALELDLLTVEAYLLLGVLALQQGQLLDATQQFERARYLDPESALVSYYLADTYRQQGRSRLALREYRTTLRKLAGYAPDAILDGVALSWIRATCQRHVQRLEQETDQNG